ncbi:MAG: hypothetical protein LQ350_000142 [Teloschistes chrysophthalmus]|nr:MAG: hypothetical protein LQ350_000142 [Niorma chrysophthalma]
MADNSQHPHADTLAPPRKSVELEDPGAHELSSDNEDEVFSDAHEGPKQTSGKASPIPITRVEKVDDHDSYGEVPGTEAYNLRKQDAVPDELEILGDTSKPSSRRTSQSQPERTSTPGGTPIPLTVVEKVDSASPSHGEVPGTAAHSMRQADAVPDVILQSPKAKTSFAASSPGGTIGPEIPIPKTVVTKVDEEPSHGEVPGTEAYDMRTEDATPDVVETRGDPTGLPTTFINRSSLSSPGQRPSAVRSDSQIAADGGFGRMPDDFDHRIYDKSDTRPLEQNNGGFAPDDEFGDDFDDFEAGGEDEDFGDFDDGFEEPPAAPKPEPDKREAPAISTSPFPPVSLDEFASIDNLLEATKSHLDTLFPNTLSLAPQPPSQPSGPPPSLFLTDRSHSLFTQLIAPPPLSPPNWLRSRTRRLFLVSLGVPIDLDEILPKSKQKKLVLPSTIRSDSERRRSESRRRGRGGEIRGLRDKNASSTSISSQTREKDRRRRKGGGNDQLPPNPPPLDLPAIHHVCSTTEAALQNMTGEELKAHAERLEEMTKRTGEVLEYWVKRRDAAMGEKEMFESVVGNLVKHAQRPDARPKMYISITIVVALSLLAPLISSTPMDLEARTCPTTIIRDPSFESGIAPPTSGGNAWTVVGFLGSSTYSLTQPGSPNGGKYAFTASLYPGPYSPTSGEELRQTLSTCAGKNYSITADFKFNQTANNACFVRLQYPFKTSVGSVTTYSATPGLTPNVWSTTGSTFQAVGTSSLLQFFLQCGNNEHNFISVDNVRVKEFAGNAY